MPIVSDALGEEIRVPKALLEMSRCDLQRAKLQPAALRTLEMPSQIWRFTTHGGRGVEHLPHFGVFDMGGEEVPILVGARKVDGTIRAQTWFVPVDVATLMRRYRGSAQMLYPPLEVEASHFEELDAIYLTPKGPIPYRVERALEDASVFVYLSTGCLPQVVGLEIQDASRVLLNPTLSLGALAAAPCLVDGEHGTVLQLIQKQYENGGK